MKLGVPSDLYGFHVSVNSSISLGVSSAPLYRLHEKTEGDRTCNRYSDTYFTFFPESLDLRAATDNPSGRPGGGCDRGFVFKILVTDGVNGGGMLATVPAGSPEPLARVLLPLSPPSTPSPSPFVAAFLPFFVDFGFAGVFFFSGDTVIGCSSEWRERYHRQSPLCTPRSPTKNLAEH